ncbi:transporter substrate-binding domain-containing protein [Roseomonas sp. AR75]|jgi:polar amino acid transport system substrate-binding protein|uniref:transporter substrate-binding domain-containing protein n=1 Tax=Roseomonas sp. AR75 TaxID=2562311 RepID=UPI0010C06823|nr:transporter substrate-binding domain-containing protein [Roseomonas sp. AR75]
MPAFDRRALFGLTAAAAGSALLPAAAAARPLEQVLSTKRLRAGINPTLPPFGTFNERNQIDGFDADIAREIARQMGVELEIVQVGSPDRIPFLQADRIDIVLGAITRTVQRALVIDYTQPLHTQSVVVLTKSSGTAIPITKLADLNNRQARLVQVRGTIGIPWIQANAPQAQVTLLDNYPDTFRAMAQGRADAMVDVMESVVIPMRNFQVPWKILDEVIASTWVGIGVQKGNTTLRDVLNIVLFEMHRSGFVNTTWQKWFGEPMKTPIPFNPMF